LLLLTEFVFQRENRTSKGVDKDNYYFIINKYLEINQTCLVDWEEQMDVEWEYFP